MYYFQQSDLLYDPLKNAYFRFEQSAATSAGATAGPIGTLVPVVDGSIIEFAESGSPDALDAAKIKIGIDVTNGARYAFWKHNGALQRAGLAKQFGEPDALLQFGGFIEPLGPNGWQMGVRMAQTRVERENIITALARNKTVAHLITGTLPQDLADKLKGIQVANAPASAPAATKPSYEAMNKSMPGYDPVAWQDVQSVFTLHNQQEGTSRAVVNKKHWDRNLGPYINRALNEARASLLTTLLNEMPKDATTIDAAAFKTRLLNIYRAAITTDAAINNADSAIVQQLRGELLWAESIVGLYSSISPDAHFDDAYAISVAAIQATIRQIAPGVSIDAEKIIKPPQSYHGQTVAYVQQTLLPANRAEALTTITGRGLSPLGQDLLNAFAYEMLPREARASPPQLDPANANFLADYQRFLKYVQVKRFAQDTETELDAFKANDLTNMSADAQAALINEYNQVIDYLLIADNEGYEHVDQASIIHELEGAAVATQVLAEDSTMLTNAKIAILNQYAYLLSDQQLFALQQHLDWVKNLITDSSQLASLIEVLPEDARLDFLEQRLGIDWVKNLITDSSQLASLIEVLPEDVRLDFLEQRLGIDWVRNQITDRQQLESLVAVLPDDARVNFLEQLGISWVKDQITDGMQLADLMREVPEDETLEFLEKLEIGWVKGKITNGYQLADLIDTLPRSARFRFLEQQLGMDWVKGQITDGSQLVYLIRVLPKSARFSFLEQQLGIDWIKGKITDGSQLVALITALPANRRQEFVERFALDWVNSPNVSASQIQQIITLLLPPAGTRTSATTTNTSDTQPANQASGQGAVAPGEGTPVQHLYNIATGGTAQTPDNTSSTQHPATDNTGNTDTNNPNGRTPSSRT